MNCLSPEDLIDHKQTAFLLNTIKDDAFTFFKERIIAGKKVTEQEVQTFIIRAFKKNNLTSDDDKPIVAVNEHAAIPHYFVSDASNKLIQKGDLLLIDLWARKKDGIYADITWMGYLGSTIPKEHEEKFSLLVRARDKTLQFLQEQLDEGNTPTGGAIDDFCRAIIIEAGYGKQFIHNTGHSIGRTVHWTDTHLRTIPQREQREVHKGLLFSVEPGIYFPEKYGYRTEIDAYIDDDGNVRVTGQKQERILALLL